LLRNAKDARRLRGVGGLGFIGSEFWHLKKKRRKRRKAEHGEKKRSKFGQSAVGKRHQPWKVGWGTIRYSNSRKKKQAMTRGRRTWEPLAKDSKNGNTGDGGLKNH